MIDPIDHVLTIRKVAKGLDVHSIIHIEDFIWQFLIANDYFQTRDEAIEYYFNDAKNSAKLLDELISSFLPETKEPVRLLEFASGYGCVTRHLLKSPKLKVTASDIHPAAMKFIADNFQVRTVISNSTPEKFESQGEYDVTFALSFFSHMPDETWGRWLHQLLRTVRPGGLLIFTTQAQQGAKYFGYPKVDERGYWFHPSSEQHDLDTSEYGQTIVTPKYVFNQIDAISGAIAVFFQRAYWWNTQDVYIIRRGNANLSEQDA